MRIRTIKPEFFRHSKLFDLEVESNMPIRLAFAGLWGVADREGRFKWEPRELKIQVLPYDELDFSDLLENLVTRGFLVKYACPTRGIFAYIPSFTTHQIINNRESPSILPSPDDCDILPCEETPILTRAPRVPHATLQMLRGREWKGMEKEWKGKEKDGAEKTENQVAVNAPPTPSVNVFFDCTLRLNDGTDYRIAVDAILGWSNLYPAVDVAQELRNMSGWLAANPGKRKTRSGVEAFIVRWLSKEQNRGGSGAGVTGIDRGPGPKRTPSQKTQDDASRIIELSQQELERLNETEESNDD